MVRFAEDPALFSYLHDCIPGTPDVVLGDGRLELARAPAGSFDLLVLDANPLDDIKNTRRISSIYLRGVPVSRAGRREHNRGGVDPRLDVRRQL